MNAAISSKPVIAAISASWLATVLAFIAGNPIGLIAALFSITASVYSILSTRARNKRDRARWHTRWQADQNDDLPY